NRYPYDLNKPIPLHESRGRLIVPANFFFNNDLEYLRGESNDQKYTSSVTKTKAAKYEMEGIEDMVPMLWSPIKVAYDKYDALGISYWGLKRQRYGHLKDIFVRRAYQKLYKFIEGNFLRLHLNDIEDMLLLVAQNKLNNLDDNVIVHLTLGLRMFTRRIVIQSRVEDLQPGVESYQKKLNISKPQTHKLKRKRLMRTDELYKFSDGTLTLVRNTLHQMLMNFRLGYNKAMKRGMDCNRSKADSHHH
nr:hypothetical protein [Tanacetum cinerariifolium]